VIDMTEEIDVQKLTRDAFTAIDALFTDEDDIFSGENEKQPDDFEMIQEYMLAIEWECSDKNIRKFSEFLDKITPRYSGKHNQDMLKMLTSIVRYLDKSKEKALPETHNVMESIVKTFKSINKNGVDEATIKQERNDAYNKVLDLKSKISKIKRDGKLSPDVKEQGPLSALQPKIEQIEHSQSIVRILTRLEFCEKRLAAMDAQNIKLEQQIGELTSFNHKMAGQINALDVKLSDQINEMAHTITLPLTHSDVKHDMDNLSFAAKYDDEIREYDEISFDGLDFNEMTSDTEEALGSSGIEMQPDEVAFDQIELDELQLDEVALDEIEFDNSIKQEPISRFEIDFEQINPDAIGIADKFDNSILFEEITIDDLKYDDDLTLDDLKYNDKPDVIDDSEAANFLELNELEYEKKESDPDDKDITSEHPVDSFRALYIDDASQYVRCFKIEDEIIAFPDDKIYNIYKIPSKISKNINYEQSILLGQFASFSQSLSKNMTGHLKEVNATILKQMKVDIHRLTNQEVRYKIALLCTIDNKVSIIPVTDICGERTRPFSAIKDGQNSFSDYNINIVNIGTIPFVPFSKK